MTRSPKRLPRVAGQSYCSFPRQSEEDVDMMPFLQGFWEASLKAVFPPKCLLCSTHYSPRPSDGRLTLDPISYATTPYFCDSCRRGFSSIASPFCTRCGLPFISREGEGHSCSECLLEKRYFRRARAFGVYDGSLMEAIHLFKYKRKTSLTQPLSGLAKETFFQFWDTDSIDLFVSVPLHMKRFRERGFNQAHLLVRRWAKQQRIPLDGRTLSRSRRTEPQTNLSGAERRRNVKGAFSVQHPERIKGQKILLVDDVYTTGATVNECARVLLKAEAKFVDVLTLARAV